MKKFNSVICLSFLVLFLIEGCDKSSSDNTNKSSTQQSSSDWIKYWNDDDGNVYSYKNVNIRKNKGEKIVQVWGKKFFSNEGREEEIQERRQYGVLYEGYDKISEERVLIEIDCKKKINRQPLIVIYDTDGKIIGSLSNYKPKWTSIVSGSEMDSLQKEVCK